MGIKTFFYIAVAIHLASAGCPFSSPKEAPEEPLEAVKDVADPETTTPNGCTCTSLCGASADDLFKVSFQTSQKRLINTFLIMIG